MRGIRQTTFIRLLIIRTLLVGFWSQAFGIGPPLDRPLGDVQGILGLILDRLKDLEAKIDNQTTDLRGVAQNWDKKLDSTNGDSNGCNSDRFTCLWPEGGNKRPTVVRDNEAGLVWDRSPEIADGLNFDGTRRWTSAISHCANKEVGGRKGWSLPMREQLGTLTDTQSALCAGGGPCLTDGPSFITVQLGPYWTGSTVTLFPAGAWNVFFGSGVVAFNNKSNSFHTRCVRGGQTYDGQDVVEVLQVLPRSISYGVMR